MKKILLLLLIFLPILTLAESQNKRADNRKITSLLNIDPEKLPIDSPLILNNSIVFFYRGKAQSVHVCGNFNNWNSDIVMYESKPDFWVCVLIKRLSPGQYEYRFKVNGLWIADPLNPNFRYDEGRTKISLFILENEFTPNKKFPFWVSGDTYKFQHQQDSTQTVYLVGDFNNWNPFSHPMSHKGAGIFEIDIELDSKKIYLYSFVADGLWKADNNNRKQYRNAQDKPISAFYADQGNSIF